MSLVEIEFLSLINGTKRSTIPEFMLLFGCLRSFINLRILVLCFRYYSLFSSTCFSIPFSESIISVRSSSSLNAGFCSINIGFGSLIIRAIIKVTGFGLGFLFSWFYEFHYPLYPIRDYFLDSIYIFTTGLHGFHAIIGSIGFMMFISSFYDSFSIFMIDCNLGYSILSLH